MKNVQLRFVFQVTNSTFQLIWKARRFNLVGNAAAQSASEMPCCKDGPISTIISFFVRHPLSFSTKEQTVSVESEETWNVFVLHEWQIQLSALSMSSYSATKCHIVCLNCVRSLWVKFKMLIACKIIQGFLDCIHTINWDSRWRKLKRQSGKLFLQGALQLSVTESSYLELHPRLYSDAVSQVYVKYLYLLGLSTIRSNKIIIKFGPKHPVKQSATQKSRGT